jgi:aspartyl-tRNA(Asn)/glutamyl-tRNA(Gln) amidotransferase subunit A
MSTDLSRMNATDAAAGYRARQFSPVEVAKALLQTIERREPELNAMWLVKGEAALSLRRSLRKSVGRRTDRSHRSTGFQSRSRTI